MIYIEIPQPPYPLQKKLDYYMIGTEKITTEKRKLL